jgi:Mrp family chromosome partitioning ATPase
MVGLARELKTRYPDRIVLYDLSPVLITDDAIAFLQYVECCLLVFQEGTTRKGDIERTLDLLEGCNLIGTVLNKSTQRSATYY